MLVPKLHALLQELPQFLLRVADPPSTGSVRGHGPIPLSLLDPLLLPGLDFLQQRDRLLRRQRVRDVPEVDTADHLLGRHLRHDAPDRLVQSLGPQVPERVDDRPQSEMDHPLLWSNPPELAVGHEVAPCLAPIRGQLVQLFPDNEGGEGRDRSADDLVAATDRKGLEGTDLVSFLFKSMVYRN